MASVEDVAAACHVTPRRIQQLVHDGMPKGERGEYDLESCMSWYIAFLQTELKKRGPGAQAGEQMEALRESKRRLVELQVEEKEVSILQARRQLIPIKQSMVLLERVLFRLRGQVLNLPGKYAPRMVGLATTVDAQARLESVSEDLLLDLQSAALPDEDDELLDDVTEPPAPEVPLAVGA